MDVWDLVRLAFGVRDSQMAGAPAWIKSDGFDIQATASATGTVVARPRALQMLQTLEDRFHLRWHKEMREMAVYALGVATDGPKLTPAKEDQSGWDDEEIVRNLAPMTLEGAGFLVLPARDGEAAIKICREVRRMSDARLADVQTGNGVTCIALAEHLLKDRPEIKVLVMWGFKCCTKSTYYLQAKANPRLPIMTFGDSLKSVWFIYFGGGAPMRNVNFGSSYDDPLTYLPRRPVQEYAKGRNIYDGQHPPNDLYAVILGRVKISNTADDGCQMVGRLVRAEGLFGESCLVAPTHRSETAGLDNVTLMCWSRADIEAQIDREPRLGKA